MEYKNSSISVTHVITSYTVNNVIKLVPLILLSKREIEILEWYPLSSMDLHPIQILGFGGRNLLCSCSWPGWSNSSRLEGDKESFILKCSLALTSRIMERMVVMSEGFSMSCLLLFRRVIAASRVAQFSISWSAKLHGTWSSLSPWIKRIGQSIGMDPNSQNIK
jgi:hypothetical protein